MQFMSDHSVFKSNKILPEQTSSEESTEAHTVNNDSTLSAEQSCLITTGEISPSALICSLCEHGYDSFDRHQMLCCRKHACLKCLSIWFFHYGKICPFCAVDKSKTDTDITRLVNVLLQRELLLRDVHSQIGKTFSKPLLHKSILLKKRLANNYTPQETNASTIVTLNPTDASQSSRPTAAATGILQQRANTIRYRLLIVSIVSIILAMIILIATTLLIATGVIKFK